MHGDLYITASEGSDLKIIQCLITELGCNPNTPEQQWRSLTDTLLVIMVT